ncbi:MAG TPA: hypothetical protein VL049_07830, partial [Candidatus Dormibacteraeota bacterium]|nr:hypothetical protein [Candidatus Dormibacteraeota bacterium]
MSKSAFKIAAIAAGATLALAASAQAVIITIGDATGNAGDTVGVDVTLNSEGSSVAGAQNDITFGAGSGIAVAAKANGKPNCAVNEAIDKASTTFAFQPSGCTAGTDCAGVRALVLSFDNVTPIPTGSVLYTCQVAIASDATGGDHALTNSNTGASDPGGTALATTGVSGNVSVGGPPPGGTVVGIGTATGNPGDTVGVDVSLTTDASIAGTQNDIAFAAPIAIAAKANGKPNCAVNEAIDKASTTFAFQPSGCTAGTDCTGVRALVLSFDNVTPIPTGSVLYTCQVAIAGDAASGDQPLTCSNPGASDPGGTAVPATCTNGKVTVGTVTGSTLANAISASDTTIPLVDASSFPESGIVQIGDELITYTGKDGNSLTGATRGALGTTAA